jgi:hypothetical protein
MLSVAILYCNAECHHADCHYAECCGAVILAVTGGLTGHFAAKIANLNAQKVSPTTRHTLSIKKSV